MYVVCEHWTSHYHNHQFDSVWKGVTLCFATKSAVQSFLLIFFLLRFLQFAIRKNVLDMAAA